MKLNNLMNTAMCGSAVSRGAGGEWTLPNITYYKSDFSQWDGSCEGNIWQHSLISTQTEAGDWRMELNSNVRVVPLIPDHLIWVTALIMAGCLFCRTLSQWILNKKCLHFFFPFIIILFYLNSHHFLYLCSFNLNCVTVCHVLGGKSDLDFDLLKRN